MNRKLGFALISLLLLQWSARGGERLDFRKDVEPILQKHCLRCHGADKRKGGLAFISRKEILIPADSGKIALVPGDASKGELMRRVLSTDKDERMPPSGPRLTANEVERLRRWIDQGAVWPSSKVTRHWAYVPPVRPALPVVQRDGWAKNPIDRFILARLEREKLAPSPEAERERLIRRVSLDLIGLPPTIAEVDDFLRDCASAEPNAAETAYEKVVDRLLASPHYGERWARHWLDLARYADSNGFQRDGFRTIWPYRDWVVNAFNRDMPFDQFTIEQIAGDLLPGDQSGLSSKIATGFNRCTTVNVEAGTDREENRVNAVFDRVNTTATVWLGTTMTCAQCHNHKYDPFSTVDYYRLFAYFNNTEEETAKGTAAVREFIGPKLTLAIGPEQEAQRKQLNAERAPIVAALAKASAMQGEWEKQTRADQARLQQLPAEIRKVVGQVSAKRTKKQAQDVADYFLDHQPAFQKIRERLRELDERLAELTPVTTLVMSELPKPRATHVFKRGNFLDKGPAVLPGVPEVLHPLAKDAPPNRLGLARWLADAKNPLIARVTVNRWWAEFFGHGIVGTLEDFGSQSDTPTHAELLDWLAVEFMAPSHGKAWSMKQVHRLIVTSATYKQSSRISPELVNRDPENRLYARGPRVRLAAETIRDNALAVSGLLARKLGGPPVMPPQPAGIWTVTGAVDNTYRTSVGPDRYRRGLYTIWRRSSPYPSMTAFDAPDRASCIVKRPRTNTPLQALTLLNDPVYVEAALAFGKRILNEGGKTTDERITFAFRLCLARTPTARERELLKTIHHRSLARYQENPKSARTLVQSAARDIDPAEWAAWFQVATVLLNLDEAITKG